MEKRLCPILSLSSMFCAVQMIFCVSLDGRVESYTVWDESLLSASQAETKMVSII